MTNIVAHIVVLTVVCFSSDAALYGGRISEIFKKDLSDGFVLAFSCSPLTLQNKGKSLSLACIEFLTTQDFNLTSFQSSARGLCESCGIPLYEIIRDCVGEAGRFLATIDILCATNEKGNKCYNTLAPQEDGRQLFSDCELSPCSSACKRDLETSNEQHGCCVYSSVALLADVRSAEQIWSQCDVNRPGLCKGAFTSSVVSAPSSAGISNFISSYMHTPIFILITFAFTIY